MRVVIKWFVGLLVFLIVFVTTAYLLAKTFEEPVRNYILKEVNKRLDAPLHSGDINFSLLERFPSASLVMDSVWAEENIIKIGDADTLFFFRKLYLNLNLFDLLDGNYRINEIEARDGFMRLLVDEKGYDNFHIWKESEDTTGFLLELDKVHVENGRLSYRNLSRQQEFDIEAGDLYFNGQFSTDNYTMAVKGDGVVHQFKLKESSYLEDRYVEVESELDIITESETYSFRKGRLIIDEALDFNIAGKFEGNGVDLHIRGNELDIIRFLSLIPQESKTALEAYESSGQVDFDCTLVGAFGKTENPRLTMSFAVENGSIRHRDSRWKLTRLNGRGQLDNGDERSSRSTSVSFSSLTGLFNDDPFSASFSLVNLDRPTIDGRLKFQSDLQALDEFFDLEWITEGSGKIELDAAITTTLANPAEPAARDFLNSAAQGTIKLSDMSLKLRDDARLYTVDSASLTIENNALIIGHYEGKINDCALSMSGRADHFLDYFFTDQGKLRVRGKVVTGDVIMETLFPTRPDEEPSDGGSVVVAFPARADWQLEVVAQSFQRGKFVAREVSGFLEMNAFKVEASGLHFLSQGGEVTGKVGLYRFGDNQFGLRTDFDAVDVDIQDLFHTFNNFDQGFITDRHLKGTATAQVQFQSFCDSTFQIDTKSIVANAGLHIRDGALVRFEPLISVADEIHRKRTLRLFVNTEELKKRLEHVAFATLENEISIRDGVIRIPEMEIKSSAMNLVVSGTHTFDNRIDYALDFALSELLELENRTEPYNEYVQRDANGQTRVYLTMKGTTDDFEVNFEKSNIKSTMQGQLQQERDEVRGLLNSEFNLFERDSLSGEEGEEQEAIDVEFDPEAGMGGTTNKDEGQGENTTAPAEQKPRKRGIDRVLQKAETDKKKLRDGDFEDDDF